MKSITLAVALLLVAGCGGTASTGTMDRTRLDRIAAVVKKGDLSTAINQLQEYLETYPQDDLAWTILGNCYSYSEQLAEAEKAYDEALKINPRRFEAITAQGVLYRKQGEYEKAMECYESAVEIDPKYAQAYSSMAVIELKWNEDEQALAHAKKAYELDRKDPAIAANLAIAYHYNLDMANRDALTRIAEQLGYENVPTLKRIYSGELSIRD